jgi:hypothetical protein
MPDILKNEDIILDVLKSFVKINAKTNLGVPANIGLVFLPWKDGALVQSAVDSVTIHISPSPTSYIEVENSYYISNNTDGMPNGYSFVGIDFGKFVKMMPDSIQIQIVPSIDTTIVANVDLENQYYANINYEVGVPLQLGKQFYFTYCDTMELSDTALMEMIFQGNEIGLFGEFATTIPFNIKANVIPIDEDDMPIDIEYPNILIAGCGPNYRETTTTFDVKFNDPEKRMRHLRKFVIQLIIDTDNIPLGSGLRPDSYIRAKLKAKMIGGIVLDLNDLNK